MTQEKMRRVITACVSAATVLLVFLLGFLIYQWITLGVKNKKIEKLESEIAYWEQKVAEDEGTEDYYMSQFYLEKELNKLELIKGK